MRYLKFRKWDGNSFECVDQDRVEFADAPPIQQYTGVDDKNGSPIYEGDVVNFGFGHVVVEWCDLRAGYFVDYERPAPFTGDVHLVGESLGNLRAKLEIVGTIFDREYAHLAENTNATSEVDEEYIR